ncbi:MAG: flavin reductase [Alphaproteobacteria bacterium MedPE-SWcel]|nr:MAG: flavin reductase [Alphaproteobacteria bacterium MedPE-SWcel]
MPFETTGADVDIGAFWKTLGERAIGATLVTTDSSQGPMGFLGLSAAHVTASPPTMIVSIDKKTSALEGVRENQHFAVNFLPAGCADLANAFGGKGEKTFEDGKWAPLATGAPCYGEALGVFDCAVERIIEHGDIFIVIGAVKAVRASGEGKPLIFFRGKWLED